jgi:hypothetical protein
MADKWMTHRLSVSIGREIQLIQIADSVSDVLVTFCMTVVIASHLDDESPTVTHRSHNALTIIDVTR